MRSMTACSTTPVANTVDAAALALRTHTPIMMPRPMRARSMATQLQRADSWNSRVCLTPTCSSRAPPRPTPSEKLVGTVRARRPRGSTGLIRRRRRRAASGSPRRDARRCTCRTCRRDRRGAHRAAATQTGYKNAATVEPHAVAPPPLCPRRRMPTRASARRRRRLCTRQRRRLSRSALSRALLDAPDASRRL